MNCKQGDLAIVVSSYYGSNSPNLGKVVTCIRLTTEYEKSKIKGVFFGDAWIVDQELKWFLGDRHFICPDSSLRPLRGDLTNDDVDTQINREAETC